MSETKDLKNPFPGLRPFERAEYRLFFGREGQSDALLERLERARFLAVVGTSGSGKSSLVRAGLLPALQGGMMAGAGAGWRVAVMRPGHDPVGNLARVLAEDGVFAQLGAGLERVEAEAVIEATLRRGSLGLVDVAQQARLGEREKLLVVVDQFEELFRFRAARAATDAGDDAAAFVKLLLEARQTDKEPQERVPIYVVLTMRSDFLGDCAQFQGLPEAINDGQYLIPRMTRDERRLAITGPVRVMRAKMTEPLVNRLLNDVGDNPDQLPILQHALMRTWDHWLRRRRDGEPIGIDDYTAVGTMSAALSKHADEAFKELPDDRSRRVAEKMFKALTERGTDNRETRRPTRLAEICAVAEASEEEVASVVEVFRREGRSFLMPPAGSALTPETVIDISHESLIRNWERLKNWADEEAQSARIYRRLAEAAVLWREGHEGLLNDPALQIALDWRDASRPNAAWAARYHPEFDQSIAYLDRSRDARASRLAAEHEREQRELERTRAFADQQARANRKLRALMVALAALLVLAVGTAIYALNARREAERSQKKAQDSERAANAAKEEAVAANEQTQIALVRAKTEAERANEQARLAAEREIEANQARDLARDKAAEVQRANEQTKTALGRATTEAERANKLLQKERLNRDALALMLRYDMDDAEKKFHELLVMHGNDKEGLEGRAWVNYNLGDLHRRLGKQDQAAVFFLKALETQERVHGKNSLEAVGFIGSLAEVLRERNSYAGSIERYEQALNILGSAQRGRDQYYELNIARLHKELAELYAEIANDRKNLAANATDAESPGESVEAMRKDARAKAKESYLKAIAIWESALSADKAALAEKYDEAEWFADMSLHDEAFANELTKKRYKLTSDDTGPQPSYDPAAISTVLPADGVGFTTYRREPGGADQYGLPSTIQAVLDLGMAWDRMKKGVRIQVGDISRKGGGPFPPHVSHRDGRWVNFRPLTNNGKEESTSIYSNSYSHDLTREFVLLIRQKFPGARIFFNDPKLVAEGLTLKSAGHDDHLNVQFPGDARKP